jgi:hypothetical protein
VVLLENTSENKWPIVSFIVSFVSVLFVLFASVSFVLFASVSFAVTVFANIKFVISIANACANSS